MAMNRKSQALLYGLMLATLLLVLVLYLSPIVKSFVTQTSTDMDCSNPTISDYDKATCYGYDIVFFMFVAGGVALVFIVIGAKITNG